MATMQLPPFIFIPNSFTPNKDSQNETFKPSILFSTSATLQIYNRWGEKLFEQTDCKPEWNPTSDLSAGVYVYLLQVNGWDSQRYQFRGTVQVLR